MPKKKTTQIHKAHNYTSMIVITAVINCIVLLMLLVFRRAIPPQIPLYFGNAEGEEQLAPSWGIIIPSAFALGVLVVNGVASYFLKNEFIRDVLMLTTIAVSILTAITTFKILLLVGNLFGI